MLTLDFHTAGRHSLHIPGPSPVPDRLLRAISLPTIDHRGPEFGALGRNILKGIKAIFRTVHPVIVYASSGTGAWEAALVNTLSPGDRVLMYETGHFATVWNEIATNLGLKTEFIGLPGYENWRTGVQADLIAERLKQDHAHAIKAVCVVHNETSTGVTSDIAAVRRAIDLADHPALLLVDSISGLGAADYRHDEWGVDVTVSGSQKGLMMPPGIAFNAISPRALEAHKTAKIPRNYWDWSPILKANETGYWPYTPNTNLLYALSEALDMFMIEGLENVFARHMKLARACRAAVNAWGLEVQCQDQRYFSPVLTGVVVPEGINADTVRKIAYERFNLSLGMGLGKAKGRIFRLGHLGDCNELSLLSAIAGSEMALRLSGVAIRNNGVAAAMHLFEADNSPPNLRSLP